MAGEALARLGSLRPSVVAGVLLSHAALLFAVYRGGVPFLMLQLLLGAELVLVHLFSALYFRRWRRHAIDLGRSLVLVIILLLLQTVAWIALSGSGGDPLARILLGIDASSLGWSIAWVAFHLALAAMQAALAAEPKLAWVRSAASDAAASSLAMLTMALLAVLGALFLSPLSEDPMQASFALCVLTVLVRMLLALLTSSFTDAEYREVAADPWAESGQ